MTDGPATPAAEASDAPGVDAAARRLLEAELTRSAQPRLTGDWPDLEVETAYRIQDLALGLRLERGEALVGVKLGLTSRAKQEQMGVDSPITAWLTDAMALATGEAPPFERLMHPRIEPELAFVMGDRLTGPGVTVEMALAAVEYVCAGMEVLDSRYEGYSFLLPDVVADNASASRFTLGTVSRTPASLDLVAETCVLDVDGACQSASGAAILGHPGEALALAANVLALRGHSIEPGWIVLTGGLTDAVPISAETLVRASFGNLGTLVLGPHTDSAGYAGRTGRLT